MFEDVRKYYVENALASYDEFLKYRSKNEWGENQLLRRGINAANALFHMREQIPDNLRPSKSVLKIQYPDYGLIADIANATKHKKITHDNPQISKAEQIFEILIFTHYADEQGEYHSPQIEVFVKLDDGTEMKLINLLYNVMCMWRDILENLGIVNYKTPESPEIDAPLTRDEASRKNTLHMRQGEEFKAQFRFMKYNYEKNIAELIDMSSNNFRFWVKKLPEKATISAYYNNSKRKLIDFDVPLTKEQASQYVSLENDDKKTAFLKKIVDNNPKIKDELERTIKSAYEAQKT